MQWELTKNLEIYIKKKDEKYNMWNEKYTWKH